MYDKQMLLRLQERLRSMKLQDLHVWCHGYHQRMMEERQLQNTICLCVEFVMELKVRDQYNIKLLVIFKENIHRTKVISFQENCGFGPNWEAITVYTGLKVLTKDFGTYLVLKLSINQNAVQI